MSLLFALSTVPAWAQSYVTAVGLRMGTDFGITMQQRILERLTVEGIVSSSATQQETTGTILVQTHRPLLSRRFNFYLGGGLHNRWVSTSEGADFSRRGVTAIAGAEVTLGRLNLSWDYKPLYHLNVGTGAFESETAISLRYVFIKKIKGKSKRRGLFQVDRTKKRERLRKKKLRQKEKRKKHRQKTRDRRRA